MANGVNWTSLLYGTVDRYLDTLDRQETRKDYLAEKEADRIYSANIRQEDLTREDAQREKEQKQRLQVWNRNENRYQDEKRSKENELKLQKDTFLIQEGREAGNLVDQRSYYSNLIDSGKLNTTFSYDTAESRYRNLGSQISNARDNIQILQDIGLEERSLKHVENLYLKGLDNEAYNEITRALNAKFTNPQTVAKAQLYLMNMKGAQADLKKVPPGKPYDTERKRLNDIYYGSTQSYLKLYDIEGIWDESAKVRHSQGMISSIQKELDEFGITFDQSKYASEFNEFAKTYYGEDVKPEDRKTSTEQIIGSIVEQEKKAKTAGPPSPDETWPDLLPSPGKLGGLWLGYQLFGDKIGAGIKVMTDAVGKAGRYAQWVTKLPGKDVGKFLELVTKETPGQVGPMMTKVEDLLSEIDDVTEAGGRGYKNKVKKLKSELAEQVNKVKKNFRRLGVSPKLRDSALEKLIRNPNKWFLPKVKAQMTALRPKATTTLRGWGGFRIAQEVGKALGDPTGGVATGLGATGTWSLAKKIYKKKGPKWMAQRLTPVIGKALTKRVMQGAVSGSVLPGWGNLIGTVLGAGFAAHDVSEALGIIGREIEEEE